MYNVSTLKQAHTLRRSVLHKVARECYGKAHVRLFNTEKTTATEPTKSTRVCQQYILSAHFTCYRELYIVSWNQRVYTYCVNNVNYVFVVNM